MARATVVGTHGAGLANLFFADHARVLELFPQWFVLPHYYYLSRSLGHSYRYCLASRLSHQADFRTEAKRVLDELPGHRDVDFRVDIPRVLEHLAKLEIR